MVLTASGTEAFEVVVSLRYSKGLRELRVIVISLYRGSFPYIFFITRAKNIVRYTESMHECAHFFFRKFSLARSFLVSPFPSHNFWRRFTEYSTDFTNN